MVPSRAFAQLQLCSEVVPNYVAVSAVSRSFSVLSSVFRKGNICRRYYKTRLNPSTNGASAERPPTGRGGDG